MKHYEIITNTVSPYSTNHLYYDNNGILIMITLLVSSHLQVTVACCLIHSMAWSHTSTAHLKELLQLIHVYQGLILLVTVREYVAIIQDGLVHHQCVQVSCIEASQLYMYAF